MSETIKRDTFKRYYINKITRGTSGIVPLVSIIDERHGISKIEHKIDSLMTRFINQLLEIALYHFRVPEPVLSPWEESIMDHTWYMRNSNWIDRQYAGKYIAIVKGNIVGSGDAGEAYEEAAKKGYQDPFLIYVVPRDIVFTVI
jgi:hypothetical protein